jgi:hypothetical protein
VSKLPLALRALHRAELSLGRDLLMVADRHEADHEIRYVARDLARWPRIHVQRLAEVGAAHGGHLNADPHWSLPMLSKTSQKVSVALGRRPEPALLLLADLRRLHRKAAGASLDWEIVAQAAHAMQATDLLELSQQCHPQTLRIMRWANAQLKVHSPQAIAS